MLKTLRDEPIGHTHVERSPGLPASMACTDAMIEGARTQSISLILAEFGPYRGAKPCLSSVEGARNEHRLPGRRNCDSSRIRHYKLYHWSKIKSKLIRYLTQ
jgi:hypothetical protein